MSDRLSVLSAREPTARGEPSVNAAKRTNHIGRILLKIYGKVFNIFTSHKEEAVKRVGFGTRESTKKDAVFLAIYVNEISPWKYFNDDIKHIRCPAIIMIDRWDGRMGFPGGTVNEGEALIDALVREVKEEVGIRVKPDKVHPIASHETKLMTHLYGLEVLEAEFLHIYYHILNNFSRSILLHAYEEGDASHFMSEITGIKIIPMVQHAGKGIACFLENNFAGSAKSELLIMLEEVFNIKLIANKSK